MFAVLVALATLAPSVFATVSVTAPLGTTTWQAGQQQTITWQESGSPPTLQQFGPSMVSIYAGNAIQQTQLQLITASADVSQVSAIQFTPDPSIGPNSGEYFIRFQSISCVDTSTPQSFPCESFSAKFTLSGMSGQFNATVQQEIAGESTAPLGGAATAASTPASSGAPTPSASSGSHSSSSAHSSAPSTGPTGAAKTNGAVGLFTSAGLVATVAALAGAMIF